MILLARSWAILLLLSWSGVAFAQLMLPQEQKIKSQADDLEDKSAQAIDDGNLDQGVSLMAQAVDLDPTPMRHMT